MPKKSKKKKRNRSKKHKFNPNKNSRVEKLQQKSSTSESAEATEAVKEKNEESTASENQKPAVKNTAVEEAVNQTSEVKDAKFSILLFLALVAIFIGLYVLMLNTSVSEFLYGLINIDNITK